FPNVKHSIAAQKVIKIRNLNFVRARSWTTRRPIEIANGGGHGCGSVLGFSANGTFPDSIRHRAWLHQKPDECHSRSRSRCALPPGDMGKLDGGNRDRCRRWLSCVVV